MNLPTTLKKTVVTLILGLIGINAAPATSRASDGCAPACSYVWVTKYVEREVAFTKVVTLYDYCGRPYKVAKTCYETVRVPIRVRVAVCD